MPPPQKKIIFPPKNAFKQNCTSMHSWSCGQSMPLLKYLYFSGVAGEQTQVEAVKMNGASALEKPHT